MKTLNNFLNEKKSTCKAKKGDIVVLWNNSVYKVTKITEEDTGDEVHPAFNGNRWVVTRKSWTGVNSFMRCSSITAILDKDKFLAGEYSAKEIKELAKR